MGPARILVIDDEPLVRWSLREKLTEWGFVVECAASGDEGLRSFADGAFDVVLLDVRMPGLDGCEVLRRMRESSPGVRVVVISAGALEDEGRRLEEAGARGCLGKPFLFRELRAAIEGAMAGC